jgi:hypothetical protein
MTRYPDNEQLNFAETPSLLARTALRTKSGLRPVLT